MQKLLPLFILAALASPAAARPCPDGQSVNPDTAGNCCWPGQAWSKTRAVCVGVPTCPNGFEAAGESCAAKTPQCPAGQSISLDTDGHCCWGGQAWSKSRNACVGVPQCPGGYSPSGESCVAGGATVA